MMNNDIEKTISITKITEKQTNDQVYFISFSNLLTKPAIIYVKPLKKRLLA